MTNALMVLHLCFYSNICFGEGDVVPKALIKFSGRKKYCKKLGLKV